MDTQSRIDHREIHRFCIEALSKIKVPAEDARATADALVYADLRGIDSHGVAHLKRYVRALRGGAYEIEREITVVHQTPSTALVDGGGGLGYPAAVRSMDLAIEKADAVGSAWVATRNSHHFGAAGFYASMALAHDMIGICITNAGPAVLPTFGIQAQLGTNPISIAIPAEHEPPYVLDMATSVKATGKIEMLIRDGGQGPPEWFQQADGSMGGDPQQFLSMLHQKRMGGQLPIGGSGEVASGYKGFGLGLAVEMLGPILAGDIASPFISRAENYESTIAHLFGALRIDAFRPAADFKADMDSLLIQIKRSPKAPGHDRIWIAGEKEHETCRERRELGVPLHDAIVNDLRVIARELDVAPLEVK